MIFEKWPLLNRCLQRGSLAFVDCAFADSVLKKLNSDKEDHAAFLAVLFALSRQGHMTLDVTHDALHFALQLLAIEDHASLAKLILSGAASFPPEGIADNDSPKTWICRLGNCYYLQKNWVYESNILKSLKRLSMNPPAIAFPAFHLDPCMNAAQRLAVELSLKNSLTFLTGGPGTGKTFTAAQIAKVCLTSCSIDQKSSFRILLTAPTGKAVSQLEGNIRRALKEEGNIRVGTLHAILGIKAHFHEEEEITPLFADLIIVDECSMIDAKIFSKLLMSVPNGARLILIGDKDQLPPVEAGSIFADLLDTGKFPAAHLRECLRSDRSEILAFAQAIKEGQADVALELLTNHQTTDVLWTDLQDALITPARQCAVLWDQYKDRFPLPHGQRPLPEMLLCSLGHFSLLSCMRQGPLGVDAINQYFLHQAIRQVPENNWWIAPIMITRNDHELELYNGDVGFLVRQVTRDFSLRQFYLDDYALFSDRKGGYRQIAALAINAFEYSYCLSVHKSQGSEYDEAVVLVPQSSELFGREVLYTAVTRARCKVTIAASQELLLRAIANSSRKISGVSARLQASI